MTVQHCPDTSARGVKQFFETYRTDESVCIILCSCAVEYEGRAEGILPTGNRTLLWKPDGNFLVIGSTKHKPRNWQPTGATTTLQLNTDTLEFISKRTTPREETLRVIVDTIHTATVYHAGIDPDVTVEKTEEDMHQYIINNPEQTIEHGFTVHEHEYPIADGRSIDIFGYDTQNNPTVIEVKRRRSQRKDVDQLASYTEQVTNQLTLKPNSTVRGILVAPSFTNSVQHELQSKNLEHITLNPLNIPD